MHKKLHFANFVYHPSEGLEMLDRFQEIVLPAFTNEHLRTFKNSDFFFHGVRLVDYEVDGELTAVLAGSFVKKTVLQREQIFDDNDGLVRSRASIDTAPSAFFALVLNSHKLIYMPEVPYAPTLENFRSTAETFMERERAAYIDRLFNAAKEARAKTQGRNRQPRLTKKSLYAEYPRVDLKVVPLTGDGNFERFVRRFRVLKTFTVSVLKPNNEINNDGFFRNVRKKAERLNATTTNLVHRNPEGLNKAQAVAQANAALDGNTVVTVAGVDMEGNDLKGNNEDFKLTVEVPDVPDEPASKLDRLFQTFLSLVANRQVQVGHGVLSPEHAEMLQNLPYERFDDEGPEE